MNMDRVVPSAQIDLSKWEFNFGELDAVLGAGFQEALINVLRDFPPWLSLPVIWGPDSDGGSGPEVIDATTIYLHLPFDIESDGECTWSISLEALILETFEDIRVFTADPIAKSFADRLRSIADKIDHISSREVVERT